MNTLLIANRAPDPFGPGDAKIAAHALHALRGRGHDVEVISRGETKPTSGVIHRLVSVATGAPLQIALAYSPSFRHTVQATITGRSPDVIVAVHARAAQYIPAPLRQRAFALLIDAYGRNYATYGPAVRFPISTVYRTEQRRMARYETEIASEYGAIGVVAPADRRSLAAWANRRDEAIVHLPYAVDLKYFRPRRSLLASRHFLFTGRLNYLPNDDAARYLVSVVWPRLRSSIRGAKLTIAGAAPSHRLARLAFRYGVEVKPDPVDMRGLMATASAMLVPMRVGGGVQTKILEAMASQLPVVCSTLANAGLEATPGQHLLLADHPASFVEQVEWLLERPADATAMARRAHAWVESEHSYSCFADPFLKTCHRLALIR